VALSTTLESMSDDKTRELLDQIYQLPRANRALIAIEVEASLDNEDDPKQVDTAWAEEIARRVKEVDEGLVEGVPWEEALARIRASLKEDRLRRRGEASQSA